MLCSEVTGHEQQWLKTCVWGLFPNLENMPCSLTRRNIIKTILLQPVMKGCTSCDQSHYFLYVSFGNAWDFNFKVFLNIAESVLCITITSINIMIVGAIAWLPVSWSEHQRRYILIQQATPTLFFSMTVWWNFANRNAFTLPVDVNYTTQIMRDKHKMFTTSNTVL